MTVPITANPLVAEGVAIAGALAPLGGPQVMIADQVLTMLLQFVGNYQAKRMAGTLTMDDVRAAAALVHPNLSQFDADIQAAMATKLGFQPTGTKLL